MSDSDRLAAFRERRARVPGQFDSQLAADADWLAGEVTQLRDLLRGIEWAAGDDFGAACPECQGYRDSADGHLPDCDLVAALHPENANEPSHPEGQSGS